MIKLAASRHRPYVFGFAIGLLIIGLLLVSALLLSASQYSAVASTVQAIAVIPAIGVAALALISDSRDKRVDRVLDLHKEFTSGDVQAAKGRLSLHLRAHGINGRVRPTSREELTHDPALSKYSSNHNFRPRADLDLILRFFERTNAARIAQTIDAPMLVELIGRHAAWWDLAIVETRDEVPRAPLRELAIWANDFVHSNRSRYSSFRNWGQNRDREFGQLGAGSGDEM